MPYLWDVACSSDYSLVADERRRKARASGFDFGFARFGDYRPRSVIYIIYHAKPRLTLEGNSPAVCLLCQSQYSLDPRSSVAGLWLVSLLVGGPWPLPDIDIAIALVYK